MYHANIPAIIPKYHAHKAECPAPTRNHQSYSTVLKSSALNFPVPHRREPHHLNHCPCQEIPTLASCPDDISASTHKDTTHTARMMLPKSGAVNVQPSPSAHGQSLSPYHHGRKQPRSSRRHQSVLQG